MKTSQLIYILNQFTGFYVMVVAITILFQALQISSKKVGPTVFAVVDIRVKSLNPKTDNKSSSPCDFLMVKINLKLFHFYAPRKNLNISNFLMFSGVIEMTNWFKMG